MEMQDDAMDMKLQEFVDKHGEVNIDIWRDINDPFYEKPIIYDPIWWLNTQWSLLRGTTPKTGKQGGILSPTCKKNH